MLQFSRELGLPERAALSALDQLLEATADLDGALSDAALPFDNATLQRTRRELKFRRKLMITP